jgi:outer membrane protein assembly factor BamB
MRWCVIAVVCSFAALTARGQQDLIAPPAPSDAAPSSGVYVHDSAIAMDKIALAERLEGLKEWAKSADVYQEIVEKYADRVVACHLDDNGAADQYTSVLSLVNQHLRTWPPEGLNVYRTRYELTAQSLVRSAQGDNLAPLHEAFSRYFVTDSGKLAGLKLIDAYFELGDFPAAAWIGQAMLLHPNLGDDRPGVLFRLGLAAHLSGDDKTAVTSLDELKTRFPAAAGTVGGQPVTLSDALAAYLARAPAGQFTAAGTADSWPMFGGDNSRSLVSSAPARPGARLYSINLPAVDWKIEADPTQRKALQQQDNEWRRQGKAAGIIPVADRGELFFQDNAHLYALSLETGLPLPGWLDTYPAQGGHYILSADGRSPTGAISPPTGYQLCVTVTDTAVLAIMGLADPLALQYGLAHEQDGKIVCLDRRTGRENWSLTARDLPPDSLKSVHFGGSPLVAGANVYLAALGDEGKGYEDCYVVCLDLATGAYRWSTYVAGAPNAGQTMLNNNNQITALLHVPTHLAYASGRIFVATDVGGAAALDAYNGNVQWLNLYRESDEAVNPNFMPMGGMGMMGWGGGFNPGMMAPGAPWIPPSPWTTNAPVVHDGNVFILPTDGKYLLVYDAGDGHVVKKLRKSDCCLIESDEGTDPSNTQPDTLLGLLDGVMVRQDKQDQREDLLLVATPIHVVAIDWRNYDPDHPRQSIAWASDQGDAIRGRPFLTDDSVFIPTDQMLYRVAVRNGAIVETYPAENKSAAGSAQESAWPTGEGPGNVLVCGEHVVIAGDRDICVYTPLDVARAKLDQEVAAAPADPDARLHYAEVMSLANQTNEAVQRLDEAIGLLQTQASRDRAFNDALSFAARSDARQTAALFDRAAALAQSPGQQVQYRLARARFARSGPHPDFASAIALYEEILAVNSLRTTPAPPEATDQPASAPPAGQLADTQAGLVAENAIATILKDPAGAAAYQSVEHAAASQFAAASDAHDAAALLSIATHYPNSSVAQHAELAAAALFATQNQPRMAALALRDVYGNLTDNKLKVMALDAMARNYLQIPGSAATAAGRLAAAAQLDGSAKLPAPLVLGSDSVAANTPLADAADKVAHFARLEEKAALVLPAFDLPSPAERRAYRARFNRAPDPFAPQTAQIKDVDTLIAIDPDSARFDRVATWTRGKGASIFAVGSDQPLATIPDVADDPRGAAWVNSTKDLLVWSGSQLTLIDGQKLQSRWSLSLGALPEISVFASAAPEAGPGLILQMNGRMLRRMTRQNLIPIRNRPFQARPLPTAADGAPSFDETPDESSAGPESITSLIPAGDVALLSTSTGRVLAVNLADGSVAWQERFADHGVDRVAATPDFTVIKTSDDSTVQLVVLDTSTGRLLARRFFTIDSGEFPINLAVDNDGTLAYTTATRIVTHDLFEAATDPNLQNIQNPQEAMQERPFTDLVRPGQLLLHDGQILAIADGGASLRGYSAQTGALREYTQDSRLTPMVLPTERHSDDVLLRIGGDNVYVWSGDSIVSYNTDNPELCWSAPNIGAPGTARQLLLGKDYLVLLNQSPATNDPPSWTLSAFSRAPVGDQSAESGLLVWQPTMTDPSGILSWQPVDGGFCYLAGDHTVHWLAGNLHPSAQ